MGGIGGRNFMLVRGENLPMKYPWGNLGGQVENVCPLGAEKVQSLPSSALRPTTNISVIIFGKFLVYVVKKRPFFLSMFFGV